MSHELRLSFEDLSWYGACSCGEWSGVGSRQSIEDGHRVHVHRRFEGTRPERDHWDVSHLRDQSGIPPMDPSL